MTEPAWLQLLPDKYALWQERLTHAFFDDREGQPLVMFVDASELHHLAGEGEDGPRSLASAVSQLVDVRRGPKMFSRVEVLQDLWAAGSQTTPPPTLPVLALSVLAASEMQSDSSGAKHNYYIRLARTLLPDESQTEIENLRYMLGTRNAFAPVAGMWSTMDKWLTDLSGHFGISTIREHHKWRRIGFPLSQTLIRRSDRAALTRLFAQMNFASDGVPGAPSLLRSIRVWTRRRQHGLSDGFMQSLGDESMAEYVAEVVHDLAVAWDGKIITADGKRRLDIRLTIDLEEPSARWSVPAVRDLDSDLLTGTAGGASFDLLLTTDPYSSMYVAEGLPPVTAAALTSGLSARGAHSVALFQAAKVLALAGNSDTSGWTSVDAIRAYDELVLVVAEDTADTLGEVLRSAADPGYKLIPPQFSRPLVGSAFKIFRNVVFSDEKRLNQAVAALPGVVAASLRLGAAVRPRLTDGLPLLRNVARHVYLAGGEPDLVLPGGDEPHLVMVTLDAAQQRLQASLFPFPLRRIPGIDLGEHGVDVDGDELSFEVVAGSPDDRTPPGVGSLGWVDGALQQDAAEEAICGALVPGRSKPRAVLARRNQTESWLVHQDGRFSEVLEPSVPEFAPGLNFVYFEVPKDSAAWLVQKRSDGWHVIRMNPGFPAFHGLRAADRLLWSELVESVTTTDDFWDRYAGAWRKYRAQ